MKLMITTAALGLLAASVPAAAQMGRGYSPPPATPPAATPGSMTQTSPPATNAQPQSTAQPGQKQIRPSSKALKAIVDLQTAVNKNDVANIPAKVAAAQAVASTKEDHYLIGELQLKAAVASKDNNAILAAIDAIASSGYEDPAKVARLYGIVGSSFNDAKQPAQAIAAYQKALALDPQDSDVLIVLGEAQAEQGQAPAAVGSFERAIQIQSAAGQKPQEALYKTALKTAYDAKLPSTFDIARQWVAAYPTPASWHDAIAVYRNMSHPDEEGTLDLLRLLQAAGAMTGPGDYALFAEAAADQSNFNEAQAVLDAGIAAHQVDPSNAQFRDIVAGLKGKPKASPADLAAAIKMSPSAVNLLHIGDRYYGMGDFAHASDIYRQVLSAPGADRDVANLHLGMALARAGDKAGATAAFNAVSGPRADIAKFWLAYLQQHA
jgi:tetratricopeptide (TPR) repeat protein